jgi:hypothetical protein
MFRASATTGGMGLAVVVSLAGAMSASSEDEAPRRPGSLQNS